MTARLRAEAETLLLAQYPGARFEPLAGDASTRRFWRMRLQDAGTRVLMDYGRTFDSIPDDVTLAALFHRARLPVARVLDALGGAGVLVLEDLGDLTLESALGRAASDDPEHDRLYRIAVELAAAIATRGTDELSRSERSAGPALDEQRFVFEMDYFLEHYIGAFLGRRSPPERLRSSLHSLAALAASHRRVFCHRDFHSRNLMVRTDGTLAMVDIQDARWGPDSYDLASLLCDAYVDIPEARVDRSIEIFLGFRPPPAEAEGFRNRFELVAVQRMLKALGTFGYQVAVRGNERYRSAIPRTQRRLSRFLPRIPIPRLAADLSLEDPALTPEA